jgi:NAD(P)-dependent dehydrogenase (short-subunit alcohol dehydrogenase family)
MADKFENSSSSQTNLTGRRSTKGVSRRRILVGSASVAGVGATFLARGAQANTQKPPEPKATSDRNDKFAGKVVLITGATSGIGEGTAYAFAKEGAKVFFCGRRENLGKQVEAKIKSFGGEATYMRADVRREEDVKAFINGCVQKYGRIDIAFNNAGIVNPEFTKIHEQKTEDFLNCMNTNALGTFLSMKYEIPYMLKQGGGVIVNTASVSSHRAFSELSPYSASKHAVASLTKVAALEYARNNIRVSSISPGGVDTPMLRYARAKRGVSFEEGSKGIPIGRTNTVEEMARAVMFLASDEATAFHGSLVDVTGGMLD